MGIAVKEEKDEDAVKDKTDKEITEMKKEPMEKRKLPMPTWQSKKPKNDDPQRFTGTSTTTSNYYKAY